MPRHEEQATLAYGADELFAVVADVKDYPLFVPWCSGARIHREEHEIIADAASLTDQYETPPQPCSGAFSWGSLHPVAVWHLSLIPGRNANYESRAPAVGEPSPGPVHINHDTVAKSRQQKEVH